MSGGVVTLGELRTQLLQRIDRVGSTFYTDAELNSYISSSYKELYDILIQKYGDDYYMTTPYQFTTDGTSDTYDLPADFYKCHGLDLCLNGSGNDGWVTLRPFMKAERNRYAVPNFQSFYGITNLRYRIMADKVWFTPRAMTGQVLRLWYSPRPAELTTDVDTVDGVSGWEEYIVVDSAIKALAKEESDVSVFAAQKQAMLQRIESAAENRNAAEPQTVSDSQSNWGPFGGWTGGGGGYSY